jgi:hypothetical protein
VEAGLKLPPTENLILLPVYKKGGFPLLGIMPTD